MGRQFDALMALFDAIARSWYATCLPMDTCRVTPPPVPEDAVWILTRPKIAALTLQRLEQFIIRQRDKLRPSAKIYLDERRYNLWGVTPPSLEERHVIVDLLDHQVRLLHLPSTVEETVEQIAQHLPGIWAQLTPVERDDLLSLIRWYDDQFCDECHCRRCRTPKETCRKCEIDESDL
jgi:hypothetical protein